MVNYELNQSTCSTIYVTARLCSDVLALFQKWLSQTLCSYVLLDSNHGFVLSLFLIFFTKTMAFVLIKKRLWKISEKKVSSFLAPHIYTLSFFIRTSKLDTMLAVLKIFLISGIYCSYFILIFSRFFFFNFPQYSNDL